MVDYASSNREIRDELKVKLRKLEADEKKLQDEIAHIQTEKKKILTQLAEHSDATYEENMLQLVYEQRHKK